MGKKRRTKEFRRWKPEIRNPKYRVSLYSAIRARKRAEHNLIELYEREERSIETYHKRFNELSDEFTPEKGAEHETWITALQNQSDGTISHKRTNGV